MVYNICKNGIVNEEEWDESDWYNAMAARRSFFIAFHKKKERTADDSALERVSSGRCHIRTLKRQRCFGVTRATR